MKKILVVEDEFSIRSFVCLTLRKKGYEVIEAMTGEDALLQFSKNKIDIILLDIMLPGMDGFAVCEELRKISQTIGIIMLTARGQEEDRVKGLLQGADDYLAKPFSIVELEARIISLARRLEYVQGLESVKDMEQRKVIECGPFLLDLDNKQLFCKHQEIKVTPTEFCILKFLISHRNQAFTRDDLLDEVWGINYVGDVKVVDVNMRRIRTKIEEDPAKPQYLCTVWGHGYVWRA